MARIRSIKIANFRSIGEEITIYFPPNMPVILIGENNSGKTNIIRAIDIMFGEYHPKYRDFEDHDYFMRDPRGKKIIIKVEADNFQSKLGRQSEYTCIGFLLEKEKNKETKYVAIQNNNEENQYVSNELRQELNTVLISSEHSLQYQLSYSSKHTLLSKMTKAFHNKLISDNDRVSKLKEYYKNIMELFDGVSEFKEFKDKMSSIAGEYIQNMTHALRFDFSAYDPSNYFKGLYVQPTDGANTLNFDELGTGQQQILALSFAHAYAKCFKNESGLILLIDEPEVHLHPLAQKWLAKTLYKMAVDGLQMIITTHSPYFIDLIFFEGLYIVRKENNQTMVNHKMVDDLVKYCREKGAKKTDNNTITPFYSKSATSDILKGFFAKKIVLVEGRTEELSLPIYFEKVDLNLLKEGIDIIGVGGKGELAKWWRLFTLFGIPCYVIFDNDSNSDSKGDKRKDALKAIGVQEEEIKNLISTKDWNIGDKYCIFGENFEETLRHSFNQYSDIEKEVIKELGDSKPLVAREVANRLIKNYSHNDVGWIKMRELAEKIKRI